MDIERTISELRDSRNSARSSLMDYAGLLKLLNYPPGEIAIEVRAVAQEVVAMTTGTTP